MYMWWLETTIRTTSRWRNYPNRRRMGSSLIRIEFKSKSRGEDVMVASCGWECQLLEDGSVAIKVCFRGFRLSVIGTKSEENLPVARDVQNTDSQPSAICLPCSHSIIIIEKSMVPSGTDKGTSFSGVWRQCTTTLNCLTSLRS